MQNYAKKYKVLALISGGLDSTLAAKIMINLGYEVIGLHLQSVFALPTKRGKNFTPEKICEDLNIPLQTIDFTKQLLNAVRNPKHGTGQGLNPCTDCRMIILEKAYEFLQKIDADFIVTGEVVGQRPMSQLMKHIKLINRKTKLEDYIIRPLSAKLLDDNELIRKGIVDKKQLYGISGRSRKPQIKLAKELGITDYPDAAGGCLLTDKQYCNKLSDYLTHYETDDLRHLKLLLCGRHFRLNQGIKFIIGRNKIDNDELEKHSALGTILDAQNTVGPITLIIGNPTAEELHYVAKAHSRYCDKDGEIEITYNSDLYKLTGKLNVFPLADEELKKLIL